MWIRRLVLPVVVGAALAGQAFAASDCTSDDKVLLDKYAAAWNGDQAAIDAFITQVDESYQRVRTTTGGKNHPVLRRGSQDHQPNKNPDGAELLKQFIQDAKGPLLAAWKVAAGDKIRAKWFDDGSSTCQVGGDSKKQFRWKIKWEIAVVSADGMTVRKAETQKSEMRVRHNGSMRILTAENVVD